MNISLIGMSGAGKSYIGKPLAGALGFNFVDIDTLLEAYAEQSLPEIINELGDEAFLRIEAAATEKACDGDNQLISTGGSIIYSEEAMECLRARSRVVYLRVARHTILERVSGDSDREGRIIGLKQKSLGELIDERMPLYEKYAHYSVDVDGIDVAESVARIIATVRR